MGAGPDELDRVAGALADPTRRGILVSLLRDRGERTVDEVARLAGVHRTVAFGHLERLTGLGYLVRTSRRGRPGRPAALYAARGGPLSLQMPRRQYLVLADLLAASLASLGPRGRAAARRAGMRFGEAATGPLRRPAAEPVEPVEAVEALAPLESLGCEYRVDDRRIVARNCVFAEACVDAGQLVCGLHAGILEGALRGAGLDAGVEPAGAAGPGSCAFELSGA